MNKELNLDDYLVQKGIVEFPGIVADVLGEIVDDIKVGKSGGKAQIEKYHRYGGYINIIPSKDAGSCHDLLVGICYDSDHLENRIREWLDHAAIKCQGVNRELYFFSTQWNSNTVGKFRGYIESLRKHGVLIHMIYVTEKGFSLMPV